MEKQHSRRDRALTSLLVAVTASMTISLSPMLLFFLNNQAEFWFVLSDVLPHMLALFLLLAAAAWIIQMIIPGKDDSRWHLLITGMIAACSLCYYIQSTYMTAYLPVLSGDDIDWSGFGLWGTVSLVLWGGIVVAAVTLLIIKPQWLKSAATWVSSAVLAMELLTLVGTVLTDAYEPPVVDAYFSENGVYEVSDQSNVVLMVSDTFEGTFMNDILAQYPEWETTLKDFTYYNNTTGISSFTYLCYPNLLTDVDFPLGLDSVQGTAYAFQHQTLVDTVAANGYDIAYYTTFRPNDNLEGKILNYRKEKLQLNAATKQRVTKLLLKGTLFQGVPHHLKKYFVTLTKDFYDAQILLAKSSENTPYIENDILFRNGLLTRGLTAVRQKPRYIVYQMNGVHAPYELSRDFEKISFPADTPTREKQIEASLASLKLLMEYVDELKKADIYDETTIIFTADHGFDMRFYPVLLVKEAHAEGETLQINATPLSIREDYAQLLNQITTGHSFTEAVAQLNVADDRTRYALNFFWENAYGEASIMRSLVAITGPASEPESYHVAQDEFLINDNLAGQYTSGQSFLEAEKAGDITVYGLRWDRTAYGHTVIQDMRLAAPVTEEMLFEITLTNITSVPQRVQLLIDDIDYGVITIDIGQTETMCFPVSAAMTEDKHLAVKLMLPDAQQINSASDILGMCEYRSVVIGDGTLKE